MTNQRLPYLLSQYLGKSCSAAELQEFYNLVDDLGNERELQDLLEAAYSTTLTEQQLEDVRQAKMIKSILQQVIDQPAIITSELSMSDRMPILERKGWLWSRIAVAASIAVVIGISIYFFKASHHPDEGRGSGSAQYANDIQPGKNTAILTLASGRVISLSDTKTGVVINAGSLRYNDNTFVIQSENERSGSPGTRPEKGALAEKGIRDDVTRDDGKVQMLTASTPRGGTYQIRMADGTKVWLNAASSIKFPSTFSGLVNRKVELVSGEAYFEVAKNKKTPFIVISKGQQVEVLGTHFNINSYADEESVKTTLLEGAVRVRPVSDRYTNEVLLKPGEQSLLNSDQIKVTGANLEEAIAWKEGYFRFNNEKIESIMRKLARWYDVEIKYEGPVSEEEFNGRISRNKNISQVLKVLTSTKMISFKVEGRRVTIMR